ncbi:MAG: thioredoxin family protein [Lentisphaeria bacterium]|nr:thioredoxin family protein [Lentisphaeria bacterium]
MKKFMIALTIMIVGTFTLCAAPKQWLTDYDAAVKQAQKEKKTLLVLFTGSDWCPGCIALNEHALSKPEFLEFAKKHLVLVYMDSPRRTPQSAAERAAVAKLDRKLAPGPYIPATVIVSNDGRILERIVGAFPAAEYIQKIKAAMK